MEPSPGGVAARKVGDRDCHVFLRWLCAITFTPATVKRASGDTTSHIVDSTTGKHTAHAAGHHSARHKAHVRHTMSSSP